MPTASKEQRRIQAIEAGRARRAAKASADVVQTEWFIDQVQNKVNLSAKQRVRIATEFVKNSVVKNISRPVTKTVVGGKTIVSNRSVAGEYPKADKTQLMKTIFSDYAEERDIFDGFVGTPLDYGLILETRMDRSFLVRTLNSVRGKVERILTGPIR